MYGQPPKKSAWVITFYAFKGGTGRTLALSNIARYLAEDRGYRVGIIDLDLESPGVPHQSLMEVSDGSKLPRELIDESEGFMELFLSLAGRVDATISRPTYAQIASSVVANFSSRANGGLFVMPAGKQSATRGDHFRRTLGEFLQLTAALPQLVSADITFSLATAFIEHLLLDFLFIDGRTGLGSFHSIYTYSLPHALVLLTGLNDQNIIGSLDALQEVSGVKDIPPAPVFLVASPVPTVGPGLLESRLDFIRSRLAFLEESRLPNESYVFELPQRADYLLPYNDVASYSEAYFIRNFPSSGLTREYLRLAHDIEGLVNTRREIDSRMTQLSSQDSAPRELLKALTSLEAPLRLAAENISLEPLADFFTRLGLFRMSLPSSEGSGGAFSLSFGLQGFTQCFVRLELWPATDERAPWEKLARGSSEGDFELPHVLIVPQSAIGDIADRSSRCLENLDSSAASHKAADYRFLDHWYPGWRSWCTHRRKMMAVPFSMNTTMLCANSSLLTALCEAYWRVKNCSLEKPGPLFFPSNWQLLLDLVGTLATSREIFPFFPFAFSYHDRALYYEWLNLVLGFGGADIEVGEGAVILDSSEPSLMRPETIDGTRFFLELASAVTRLNRRATTGDALNRNVRMDELVHRFSNDQLALYVGWTDSFRFDWTSELTRPAFLEYGQRSSFSGPLLRLARVPRDVRYIRRPLVANWVAIFPKTTPSFRMARLQLMSLFLSPAIQHYLLRMGFPSASLPLVRDALGSHASTLGSADRSSDGLIHQNYMIFLSSLLDALTSGHSVPAFRNSTRWVEALRKTILSLLSRHEAGNSDDFYGIADCFKTVYRQELRPLLK